MSSTLDQVDDLFATFVEDGAAPGVAYGVVDGGRLVHSGGFGVRLAGAAGGSSSPAAAGEAPDARTAFRIASLTKSFTASAVLRLRDAGALGLEDPVSGYLPELAEVRLPTADAPQITVRHLLTMSAGLPTDDAWADRQESMSEAEFSAFLRRGVRFLSAPGTGFEYSNLGYAMLGRVVTRVSGREYREEVATELLAPLGLGGTAYAREDVDPERLAWGHRRTDQRWDPEPFDRPGVFSAIGGVYSTVADLARWVAGFADAFPARDDPDGHPVSRASRREMQQLHRSIARTSSGPPPSAAGAPVRHHGYGMGLFVEDDPVVGTIAGHPGGYPGYGAQMRWSTELGVGVIALANGRYARATAPAAQALDLLLDGRQRLRTAPWPETVQAALDVERLLAGWDDALADRVFADNVDLDEPRARRRAELERVAAAIGPVVPSPHAGALVGVQHPTPASARWQVRGDRGVVLVAIALTPQQPPRVQTLALSTGGG